MKKWELINVLLGGAGFYRRKFLFFAGLLIIGLGGYFLWQNSRPLEASVTLPPGAGLTSDVTMDINLTARGKVTIDGKKRNEALNFYREYDELRIMVFNSPGRFIGSFQGTVHLPAAPSGEVRQIIYAVHGVGSYQSFQLDPQTLVYEARDISPQAMLTIVADLPKGLVKPSVSERWLLTIEGFPLKVWLYVAIVLPALTIILMTTMILRRRRNQFFLASGFFSAPPTKDPPAIVGVLVDGNVGAREIAATLIDLARRDYILIVNKGQKEFTFGKRKLGDIETVPGLSAYERVLLSKIFLSSAIKSTVGDVEMRIGRHIFSRKIAQYYLGVYNQATKNGYFVKNPAKVHLIYKYAGVGLFFLSFLGFIAGALTGADPKFGLIFWVGGMAAALAIIKLSPLMPARSALGQETLKKWLGFRKYLASRQIFQAKEVLQNRFEEFLPYAVVLGAEVEWARRFAKEPFCKPEWYESAERAVTLESFMGEFFPFIGYVAENLARSHEPTVE